jgi:hypothetical protein
MGDAFVPRMKDFKWMGVDCGADDYMALRDFPSLHSSKSICRRSPAAESVNRNSRKIGAFCPKLYGFIRPHSRPSSLFPTGVRPWTNTRTHDYETEQKNMLLHGYCGWMYSTEYCRNAVVFPSGLPCGINLLPWTVACLLPPFLGHHDKRRLIRCVAWKVRM